MDHTRQYHTHTATLLQQIQYLDPLDFGGLVLVVNCWRWVCRLSVFQNFHSCPQRPHCWMPKRLCPKASSSATDLPPLLTYKALLTFNLVLNWLCCLEAFKPYTLSCKLFRSHCLQHELTTFWDVCRSGVQIYGTHHVFRWWSIVIDHRSHRIEVCV